MPSNSRLIDHAEMLTPPMPWDRPRMTEHGEETVVLLHGLWRGFHAMEPLARTLAREGFSTLNIPYPSMILPIPVLAERIVKQIDSIAGKRKIHLITHSLGGILARTMLELPHSWQLGRMVMLCPPNGGSEIVDWSRQHPLIRMLLGPAGRSLGSDGVPPKLPPLPKGTEAAVIMGNRCSIPFFKKLLDSENDGIVSASRGRIDGLRGFSVIDADPPFIPMPPEPVRLRTQFLKTGEWAV